MKTLRLLSYLLVITLSVGFVSCSDDDDDNGGFTQSKKLVAINGNNESRTFKYDSQGKVIEMTKANIYIGGTRVYKFEYSTDKIVVTDDYPSTGTYKLQNGVIVSATFEEDGMKEEFVYTYDSNKQLTKSEFAEPVWSNGNITKANFNEDGDKWTVNYSYSDKQNRFVGLPVSGVFLGDSSDLLFQMGYFGKCPSNLMIKEVESDGSSSIAYEFDAEGYVIKAIVTGDGYSEITTGTYTFVYED